MHYKNGREAKVGDHIVHPRFSGGKVHAAHGLILTTTPGAQSCNATVAPLNTPVESVNLNECLHVDDVAGGQVEYNDRDKLLTVKPDAGKTEPEKPAAG